MNYLPVCLDREPPFSSAALRIVSRARQQAEGLILPAQIEIGRTGLHPDKCHIHVGLKRRRAAVD